MSLSRSIGYLELSRQYLSNLKCPEGHNLYSYSDGDEGLTMVSCDLCSRSNLESFYGCRSCNFDLCGVCSRSTTQLVLNRMTTSNPPAVQEACRMLAMEDIPSDQGRFLGAAARGERYNGRRPNNRDQRVSHQDFPDPAYFGWEFTGSCEGGRAEFFEKEFSDHGVVKLDFYYTTGTVKTVLDHPRQGVTQLFGKGDTLSPSMYREILRNPRHHTGNRYHHRNHNY